MRRIMSVAVTLTVFGAALASGQTPGPTSRRADELQAAVRRLEDLRLKESRYQIGQMERLFEGAVEHGATVIRDRLAALMPSDMLLTENARARGFRIEGYGVFFDVSVPSLSGTLPWSFLTMNQNNLGLDSALRTVRAFVESAATNDVNVRQALSRIELQMSSVSPTPGAEYQAVPASTAAQPAPQDAAAQGFATLNDINEAYRSEIRDALIDAMLEHSRGLGIPTNENLTVAARGTDDRPRLAPADTDARTVLFTVSGSDLSAFLAGQISREEARKRVETRVY